MCIAIMTVHRKIKGREIDGMPEKRRENGKGSRKKKGCWKRRKRRDTGKTSRDNTIGRHKGQHIGKTLKGRCPETVSGDNMKGWEKVKGHAGKSRAVPEMTGTSGR